ncbi:MAG: thiopeptide-type bacteriocin biosynthesis protein, partial [Actinobacteria bacterium]|nr:thiopeptide-type bacteriocin biosynthesis protein [Actinomycetota bacterium]
MASTTPTTLSPPTPATPLEVAQGVLTVLGGTPLDQAAAEIGMAPTDLTDAIRCYQQAGYAALEAQAERHWYQVHLEFSDWESIEHTVVTGLAPRLQHLQDTGVIAAWWFIRKAPGLRLRIKSGGTHPALAAALDPLFEELTATGALAHWQHTLYEPEEAAFGGPPGMEIAHELFNTDSHHILSYLRHEQPPIGRRELSVLLCTTLFRAADQEWFECGDIWHRVARYRPNPATDRLDHLTSQLRILLAHDTHPTGPLFG